MIRVDDLHFAYTASDEPVIHGLGFEVKDGEVFGFLGPSGAGKTTTQKILIGLLQDYQGSVSVFGRDLSSWRSDYYERVGVSFEVPNLFLKLTASENLGYFASLYSRTPHQPAALLELVGLGEAENTLVSNYSKGMKNRLNVARALLHDPELLFMDEPTAGLDPVNSRRIRRLIREQRAHGKTIFLTTHDMMVADELCDRVAFIVDGEIKLIDSPRTLKLEHGQHKVRVEYLVNGATERREFPLEGLGDNGEFLSLLREQDVQTIHSLEATLEDIFIKVTGRSLR